MLRVLARLNFLVFSKAGIWHALICYLKVSIFFLSLVSIALCTKNDVWDNCVRRVAASRWHREYHTVARAILIVENYRVGCLCIRQLFLGLSSFKASKEAGCAKGMQMWFGLVLLRSEDVIWGLSGNILIHLHLILNFQTFISVCIYYFVQFQKLYLKRRSVWIAVFLYAFIYRLLDLCVFHNIVLHFSLRFYT